MKVDIRDLLFEKAGVTEKSHAHESLTLTVNEHTVERDDESSDENSSDRHRIRIFYHFIIRPKNYDPNSEPIFTFWNMEIKWCAYLNTAVGKIKLIPMPEVYEGMIAVDFVNPGDTQLFWSYALEDRYRKKVIELLYRI